ncbi:LysR family transcriptional regulator [Enterovirga sp.]|uniref:LysR family transcriptional regulator n=1 Tax=Enterovirga sp. TaxID=2026350 RepID=UPI002632383E|nr:LysR family transcriptional regulator [Enterovirga sp.]MDB5591741.1 transcriptional regulator, LysR family [Enterovirga sp.]
MYFRRLRYFEAVARCGSFSRASSELHVAQPALSSQIAELEADFGVRLFTRHSRGVVLTEAGDALLTRTEQILQLMEDVRAEMAAFRSVPRGEVRLGLPTTITGVLTLPLLSALPERLPGISLQVVEGMTGHLEKWLEQGELDAAILFQPPLLQPQLAPVGTEGLALIGPEDSELAGQSDVSFAEVTRRPLIHTTRAHHLRKMLDDRSLSLRMPLNIVAEIDSLPQIKSMVFQSRGYTVLPQASVGTEWVSGSVRAWPITDPALRIQLYVVSSGGSDRKPCIRAAARMIGEVIRELIQGGRWTGALLPGQTPPGPAGRRELKPAIARTDSSFRKGLFSGP